MFKKVSNCCQEQPESVYISGGVNDHCGAISWGNHYLAVAVQHAIALFHTPAKAFQNQYLNQMNKGISQLLCGHQKLITCLRWVRFSRTFEEDLLVSCAHDGRLCVWQPMFPVETPRIQFLPNEGVGLVYCDARWIETQSILLLAGVETASPRVHCWTVKSELHSSLSHTLKVEDPESVTQCLIKPPAGLVLSVRYGQLPLGQSEEGSVHVLLALGMDNGAIGLYYRKFSQGAPQGDWMPSLTLRGHENWVRCMEFYDLSAVANHWTPPSNTLEQRAILLLASASQDNTARIWRFSLAAGSGGPELQASETTPNQSVPVQVKAWRLQGIDLGARSQEEHLVAHSEAVLSGHESWVMGVAWRPSMSAGLELLTASWDKSVCVWRPFCTVEGAYLWTEVSRLGQVGGNSLGLYGAAYSNMDGGLQLAAHGYQGSLFLWNRREASSMEWKSVCLGTGHFGPVEHLSWEAEEGRYLLTVSHDQTTRLHGRCSTDGAWRELARPQVHGFNMNAVASVTPTLFVSAADEMVIRAFTAPRSFLDNFARLAEHKLLSDPAADAPEGATVPALGLSNKAVYTSAEDQQAEEVKETDSELLFMEDEEGGGGAAAGAGGYDTEWKRFKPKVYHEPPTEDDLTQNTLWPEVKKLYGHAYEVFTVAAHPRGELVVSACKASQAKHAAIFVWRVSDWSLCQRLTLHKLTVVQMQFSHSGHFLLAVSRDRLWSLWRVSGSADEMLQLCTSSDQISGGGHSRIIWGCAWSPDDRYFFTGSRDKSIRVWTAPLPDSEAASVCVKESGSPATFSDAVTAVDVCNLLTAGSLLVAGGLESGEIHLLRWTLQEGAAPCWSELAVLAGPKAHHLAVKCLRFQPVGDKTVCSNEDKAEDRHRRLLASCGEDKLLRVYSVCVGDLD